MSASPDECAREVLEAVPRVMRVIRCEMRSHRRHALSVPQFRVLIYLNRNTGVSMSNTAEHMGLTLPSISKMIDGLVLRNWVSRQVDPHDRRRVTLVLTTFGRKAMESAYKATEERLAERLASLDATERTTIIKAMQFLESAFVSRPPPNAALGKEPE